MADLPLLFVSPFDGREAAGRSTGPKVPSGEGPGQLGAEVGGVRLLMIVHPSGGYMSGMWDQQTFRLCDNGHI